VAPFLVLSLAGARLAGRRDVAEVLAAGLLALSAVYIAVNETFANWQSLWLCGVLLVLALILSRARDAQS
jgi:glucan 1,3-beta-glucosidase